MKSKKLLGICLSAAMLSQLTVFNGGVALNVKAASEDTVTHESLVNNDTPEPAKDTVLPSKYQYDYQKEELAAFCHFGPNTFNEIEWGESYGDRSANSIFKLTKDFDAEKLVSTIKQAGFKKLIVTAKHHDGFCIWNSAETEYDVAAATNYKNGQGDILAEISEACTRHDIDMGLYLSPWDIHEPSYGYKDASGKALVKEVTVNGHKQNVPIDGYDWDRVKREDALDYNEYYNNQLKEILGNDKYGNAGHFTEVWMDGAKGSGANYQEYTFETWFNTIQEYEGIAAGQPDDCLLFGAGRYETVRWIGNEHGFADNETWSKSKLTTDGINNNKVGSYTKGFVDGDTWTVPEADARITSGWFWGTQKKTPKSMDALSEMYFRSVGHNAPLLLNIPPNTDGTVDLAIANRLLEFGDNINKTFETNLAKGATILASEVRGNDVKYTVNNLVDDLDNTYWTVNDGTNSGSITIRLPQTTKFDIVSIEEAIEFGQRIGSYKVEYRTTGGTWNTFEQGPTVGAKRLCRGNVVEADEVRITVTAHDQAEVKIPMLSEVGIYRATKAMSLSSGIPEAYKIVDNTEFTKSNGWHTDNPSPQFINNTAMWTNGRDNWAQASFHGTKVYLYGTKDPNHGPADIYIDGVKVASIDTHATNRAVKQVIFESGDLNDGDHTIKIVQTGNKAIGVDAITYIDNGGAGAFEIENASYTVTENTVTPIRILRIGGTTGEASVKFQVNPGSAWQDHFDANGNMTVTFKDGQKEAFAKVTTKRVPAVTGTLSFSAELVEPTGNAILGMINSADINITDTEEFNKNNLKAVIDAAVAKNVVEGVYTNETYKAFVDALKEAQDVYNTPNISNQKCAEAANTLTVAMNSLTKRSTFNETDRFIFPSRVNDTKEFEAEYAMLDATNATNKDHYVRVETDNDASSKKKVGWFEPGNVIKVPFNAEKPGTYTMTVTYESGRPDTNKNKIILSGTNIENEVVTEVYESADASKKFQTVAFDFVVTQAGDGELVFTADAQASPNMDKIAISAKDVAMGEYTVTVSKQGEGTVSQEGAIKVTEGQNQELTFTPADGYTVANVLVNGKAIGPRLSYVLENVSADYTVEVIFALNAITAENPFVLPKQGQTVVLEAERLELHNTNESEEWKLQVTDADWASMGKFVNAMNSGDTMTLYYDAPQPGLYDVTVTYRSGSAQNSLSWTEANSLIKDQSEVIGNADGSVTLTKQFTIEVFKAGVGTVTFATGDKGAPQMDKFEITNNQDPLQYEELGKVIAEMKAVDLTQYQDGAEKDAFEAALAHAENVLKLAQDSATSQTDIDNAKTALEQARLGLKLPEQKPAVDKSALEKAIAEADALDLTKYQDGAEKDAFKAALEQAKGVYNNPEATEEEVSNVTLALNTAKAALKEVSDVPPTVVPTPTPLPTDKPTVKPTEKPTVKPEPTKKPVANGNGGYDDGGPFTTDECGSIYDRWGNLMWKAPTCKAQASDGYGLVNTSDN